MSETDKINTTDSDNNTTTIDENESNNNNNNNISATGLIENKDNENVESPPTPPTTTTENLINQEVEKVIEQQEEQKNEDVETEQQEQQSSSPPKVQIHELVSVSHNLFENFIVVGLPSDSNPKLGVSHKPELLFSYPDNKEVPPKVKEFCFPNGIVPCAIRRTPSRSNLNEMLFGQSYLHSSNHYFTFVLSSENPIYGICITKPELLHSIPNFFPTQPKPLEKAPTYISAPRCYCFLSKIPMFNLHFDALLYILAQDRLITTTRELSSSEDEMIQEQNQLQKERDLNYNLQQSKPLPPIPTQQQQTPVNISNPTSTTTTQPNTPILNDINSNNNSNSNNNNNGSSPSLIITYDSNSIINSDIDSTTSSTDNMIQQLSIEETAEDESRKEEIKHLVDKQNLLDILKYYSQPAELKSGQTFEFLFPNDNHVRKYQIPEGKNIQEVNAKLISEWSIGGTFANLSLECILRVLGAVLLEQRIVFVCDNLAMLSSCCFSMISLIHPLIWQGLFVPVLPQNLLDYLEAPVPFIVGVSQLQRRNFDGLIVDIKSNKIFYNRCPQPPIIPEFNKLLNNLKNDTNILINQKNYNPVKNTTQQNESIHRIYSTIQQYTLWLFKKIEIQFITVNVYDSLEIEEFKKKFLLSVSEHNKEFIKMLLDTQHFSHFLHHNLLIKQQEKEIQDHKDKQEQQEQEQQEQDEQEEQKQE